MISDETRWDRMRLDMIGSDEIRWDQMISDDIKWDQMTSDDRWDQMRSVETRWDHMTSDRIRSDQIGSDQIGSDWIRLDQMRSDEIRWDQKRSGEIRWQKRSDEMRWNIMIRNLNKTDLKSYQPLWLPLVNPCNLIPNKGICQACSQYVPLGDLSYAISSTHTCTYYWSQLSPNPFLGQQQTAELL